MRAYFKLFLSLSIPFGLFLGVVNAFFYGLWSGLNAGIVSGLLYGFMMTLFVGIYHKRSVKRKGFSLSEDMLRVHQNRNLSLSLPYETAFNDCIRALESLEKSNVKTADSSTGKIEVTVGWSWKSWGEKITINISKSEDNQTEIDISSRPTLRTTIVDYSKNFENVENISIFLRQRASDLTQC